MCGFIEINVFLGISGYSIRTIIISEMAGNEAYTAKCRLGYTVALKSE